MSKPLGDPENHPPQPADDSGAVTQQATSRQRDTRPVRPRGRISVHGRPRGIALLLVGVAVLLTSGAIGCAPRRTVTRVETDSTIDLSGRWNDVDSRETADAMIRESLGGAWIGQWMQRSGGGKPTLIVGAVRNRTAEHIPVGTFVADIERALVNSGQVNVVATAAERGDLRAEREDQWNNATEETAKQMGRELGADLMLGGAIESIVDREGGERVVFYQVDLTLLDIETNQKVWMGQKKIKKLVSQSRYAP